jgi:hypothetical protein
VANDSKYGKNRNLWRKVYGFRRRKPNKVTLVDPNTNVTFSYDLQTTVRHRDFFIIRSVLSGSEGLILAEYDEGLIPFINTDVTSANFTTCFSSVPDAVVLTIEPANDNSDNIIPYGLTFDQCSLSVGLSAPFSGNVRYRAIYSSIGYPAQAQSAFVPASGTFTVSAGSVFVTNATIFTASYAALTSAPSIFYKTPWDSSSNSDVDVFIQNETSSSTTTSGEISAPVSNSIYFIAVQ